MRYIHLGVGKAESQGARIAIASMAVSGVLALAKLIAGWLAGSASVIADGVESAGDVLASSIVLLGLTVAARPPDENHPYGHGRFETLTGLITGLGLALVGAGIIWKSLQDVGLRHQPPAAYALIPVAASVILKAVMAGLKLRIGRRIRSSALVADAWNDTVDILSGSVALLAVGLALYDPDRFLAADHYGGAAIGVIVILLGLRVVHETSLTLMDTMPDAQMMASIRASALKVPGALDVEKCYARKTGLRYHVDLHLEVDPELTVRRSHAIAEEVRNRVKADLAWVEDVLVHVEPYGERAFHGES
ncbi:MAG: cation transporter [Bryobacteraceae bacterium]|nr:MAG: cation transporter [Bryobacteraceae bacterium]